MNAIKLAAMTKTLIVFHSRTGYTRRAAQALADRLNADLDEIQIVQPLDGRIGYLMCAIEAMTGLAPAIRAARKDPANYDLIVVGTPVWFWSLASPVRSWLEEHQLRSRRFGFLLHDGRLGCVMRVLDNGRVGRRQARRHNVAHRPRNRSRGRRKGGWLRARTTRRPQTAQRTRASNGAGSRLISRALATASAFGSIAGCRLGSVPGRERRARRD